MQTEEKGTADSLEDYSCSPRKKDYSFLKHFSQDMNETDVLTLVLSPINIEDDDVKVFLSKMQNLMEGELGSIDQLTKQSYQRNNAQRKFTECAGLYIDEEEKILNEGKAETKDMYSIHQNYIETLQSKLLHLAEKIARWRRQKTKLKSIKQRTAKMNLNIYKKYNIQNYLQQLLLVKDLVDRVKSKLSEQTPDFQFAQQLSKKNFVPYTFYHDYCLNNCCRVIQKRMQSDQLIIIKQTVNNLELLKHMKIYFFKANTFYEKCQQFLRLTRYIRVTNKKDITIENGFMHLFKAFFIELLSEVINVNVTEFLKARSAMQSSQECIDIWHEFEEFKIEVYCLWYYEQFQWLKKSELVQLTKFKEICYVFQSRFQWIRTLGIKSKKIQGGNDFIGSFMKDMIVKVIKHILVKLFVEAIPSQKHKGFDKFKKQFCDYWIYTTFARFKNFYHLFKRSIQEIISTIDLKNKNQSENDLGVEQYYHYYKQIPEIIEQNYRDQEMAKQFSALWLNLCAQYATITESKHTIYDSPELKQKIAEFNHIKGLEIRLSALLETKGISKREDQLEIAYGLMMNLNFTSKKFFLVKEASKLLGKAAQKQIIQIREIAYRHFFSQTISQKTLTSPRDSN